MREAGGGDLVATFAGVPMHVMCALVGVPVSAVPELIAWVDALSPVFGLMEPPQIATATTAIQQLLGYVGELVEHRSHTPADDLMTSLVRAEHDGDRLTREETIAMVANLLVGGHDTTSSQIGCTLFTLLDQPGALKEIRADGALVPAVVAETIRFEPSIAGAGCRRRHDRVGPGPGARPVTSARGGLIGRAPPSGRRMRSPHRRFACAPSSKGSASSTLAASSSALPPPP